MKPLFICFLLSLCICATGLAGAQDETFLPVDHTYVYDLQGDGSARCTWSTTLIPKSPTILYTLSFTGGTTRDYEAGDELGQLLDADVSEQADGRNINIFLSGYQVDEPYTFDLSFTWDGLLDRKEDKHLLFTSVNVGDPQAAKIVVMPPEGSRIGTSVVTKGNSTEAFEKDVYDGRDALVWSTPDTGDDTQLMFRANYYYSTPWLTLRDNYMQVLTGAGVLLVGGLLLGYRRKLPGLASRVREMLKSETR